MQARQTFHVGTGNIDDKEIDELVQHRESVIVIPADLFLGFGSRILGDIGGDDDLRTVCLEIPDGLKDTFVVDTHAVDERLILGQPEKAGFRVAGLRLRSQGTDFNESETEMRELIVGIRILVQSAGQTDRIGEPDPEDFPFQGGIVPFVKETDQVAGERKLPEQPEATHRQLMGKFRIEPEQDRSDEEFVHVRGCL